MAVRHGYGKIAGADALVFAYDTGDTRNSYKGEPTTNLLTGASDMVSNGLVDLGANMEYQGRIEDGINVNGINYPSFRYKSLAPSNSYVRILNISVTANTQYTFSIYGKMSVGTSTQNVGALYSTDYNGIMSPSTGLTSDWQKIYYTFTTGASSTNLVLVFFGYDNATNNVVEYALPHLEAKSHPTQFVNGTRSATQGLLDLTGRNSLDLSNASFNSNAEIEFDGTDSYIQTNFGDNISSQFTAEFIFYATTNATHFPMQMFVSADANTVFRVERFSAGADSIEFGHSENGGSVGAHELTSLNFPNNTWHHCTLVYDGSYKYIYKNGTLDVSTADSTVTWYSGATLRIGARQDGSLLPLAGYMPVVKIYNRALTADEIRNNFRLYKTRFGI